LRNVTERTEGIKEGTALLVGTDRREIVSSVKSLLSDSVKYNKMAKFINPYGDGKASVRIRNIIMKLVK
jgi:UDP-N-acetylglucosamine 2-epimerase (non-hydrolysing)